MTEDGSIASEIARQRKAASKNLASSGPKLDEHYSETEAEALATLPPTSDGVITYRYRTDDPALPKLRLAIRCVAKSMIRLEKKAPREFMAELSSKMESAVPKRHISPSEMGNLQTVFADNNTSSKMLRFALAELSILGDPDIEVYVLDLLRLARIAPEASSYDEVKGHINGKARVPITAEWLPCSSAKN